MKNGHPSIQTWLDEIKAASTSDEIGIFFIHNGVVRGTTREGMAVSTLEISYDRKCLDEAIAAVKEMPGVVAARAWINEGTLSVGDDMILALVAGDVRRNVFRGWETLVRRIKSEVVVSREVVKPTHAPDNSQEEVE